MARCWLLVLTACAAPPAGAFPELDVVVGDGVVQVYARDGDCTCNVAELPDIGECLTLGDVPGCNCTPAPASCLQSLRIEQDGLVVVEQLWTAELADSGVVELAAPTGSAELVVVGCGGSRRLPLSGPAPAVPEIAELTYDGVDLTIASASAPGGANSLLGGFDHGAGGNWCRVAADADVVVDARYNFEYLQPTAALIALATTDYGDARVHVARATEVANLYLPTQLDDGRWTLPPFVATGPTVFVQRGGSVDSGRLALSVAAADLSVSEPLVSLAGSGSGPVQQLDYRAGADWDSLTMTAGDDQVDAVFGHRQPVDGLDVGGPEADRFEVVIPGAALGVDPISEVRLVWDLGVVARPVAR